MQFEFPTKGPATEMVRAVNNKPGAPYDNHIVITYHLVEKFRGRQFKHCKLHQFSFVQNLIPGRDLATTPSGLVNATPYVHGSGPVGS